MKSAVLTFPNDKIVFVSKQSGTCRADRKQFPSARMSEKDFFVLKYIHKSLFFQSAISNSLYRALFLETMMELNDFRLKKIGWTNQGKADFSTRKQGL